MARPKATAGDGKSPSPPPIDEPGSYTVVARRYRPQRFEDVVGQDHVVQALRNAIRLNRVTHAYLFSGTRGVGKTSIARIFAKCLNCVRGPTDEPCLECDSCRLIAVGEDVDVIEIDGASNNGVEAVRELRQNAGLRPSRGRYKIYYIDEVHMLSTGAFNALLKTLEEPPEHVKFFFATTEPNKIPITVLSRCQRYDFAGISPEQIVATLAGICERERIEADPEALRTVARRAGGSMRDAQSLLEQLLSSGAKTLTVELVHQALGIAPDERVLDLIEALAGRDAARALQILDEAVHSGVQPVDMLQGCLEFLRDVMVMSAGATVPPLAATPAQKPRVRAIADRWSFDSVLATLQILAETRGRLRGSPHGRLLVELALCRIARLEDLAELGTLVGRLAAIESGAPAPAPPQAPKKKWPVAEPPPVTAAPPPSPVPAPVAATPTAAEPPPQAAVAEPAGALDLEAAQAAWAKLMPHVGAVRWTRLSQLRPTAVDGPDILVVAVPERYNWVADDCDTPEARPKIEEGLRTLLDRPVRVRFDRIASAPEPTLPPPPSAPQVDELASEPMVRFLVERFDARKIRVEVEDERAGS